MKKRMFKINQIAKTLGVEPQKIANILKDIVVSGEGYGFLDEFDMTFYQFTNIEYQNLITKFNNSKFTLAEGIEIVLVLLISCRSFPFMALYVPLFRLLSTW